MFFQSIIRRIKKWTMCEKNFAFWCCAFLLLVSSSSKSQENSTNNQKKDVNSTVRYELDMNSTTKYGDEMITLDLYEKFTNNTRYNEMQYESHTTYTSNNSEDDDSIQYKRDKHSIQNHENDEKIPMKSYANSTDVSYKKKDFDKIYTTIFDVLRDAKMFLSDSKNYLIAIQCVSKIVSILLLVSIFLVYSILPEFRNVHGFMLRNYSGALFIAYIFEIVSIIVKADDVQHSVCITIAFLDYFLFLTSSFWLIMISFDMWWTFRGFCSIQGNARRQRQKKKLVYYAICGWGCPFIFAIISIIMDYFSEDLPKILRPEFVAGNCWFHGQRAFALYYFGPKSVCIISSICLFISTALKIARYQKDTGLCLTDSKSKRYNDSNIWFKLYLKLFIVLFIVMGIRWSIVAVSWSGVISNCVKYFMELMDIISNLCTFIIFVWKKKIQLMLLKRFSCGLFPEARCGTNATSSSTCTTTLEVSLQEKMSSCRQENHHVRSLSVGTEL